MKLSFKKHRKMTGLRAVGHPYADIDIRIDGQDVGTITAPTWQTRDQLWRVMLKQTVTPTPEAPCPWEWITLKWRGQNAEEAQQFVKDNIEQLDAKFKLYRGYPDRVGGVPPAK